MKLIILVTLFGVSLAQHNPHTRQGRTAIVHLFEWRWADIAAECERFLAPNGFAGVQVCITFRILLVTLRLLQRTDLNDKLQNYMVNGFIWLKFCLFL